MGIALVVPIWQTNSAKLLTKFSKSMKKDIQEKIRKCKALQGKSILDIIQTDRFRDNLAAYWTEQRETRSKAEASYKALAKLGGPKGMKLPSHTVARLAGLSVVDMAVEYAKVICGHSERSNAERIYIKQLGQQAFNRTMIQYVLDEFPELSDELNPKTNEN